MTPAVPPRAAAPAAAPPAATGACTRTQLAQDVVTAADWLADIVGTVADADLERPARRSAWTCWRSIEHVVDDLLAYALQVASGSRLDYLPLEGGRGEDELAHVSRSSGAPGLAECLRAGGRLLAAQVAVASDDARAHHPFGLSDPGGFAAMGVVEILVHGFDVATALGAPDADTFPDGLAEHVLDRLFPDVPHDVRALDASAALLWATGRIAVPGHDELLRWRWDSSVR